MCRQPSLGEAELIHFQQLVADKQVNINFTSNNHNTPILMLCRFNNSRSLYPCLKSLLAREDIDINFITSTHGRNCLMILCRYCTLEDVLIDCIRLLIKRGVDCNRKSGSECDSLTALRLLSLYAHPSKYLIDVVRLLINDKSDLQDATKSSIILRNRGLIREANILLGIIQSYYLGRGHIPNEVMFVLQ